MRLLLDTHALIWWDEGHGLHQRAVDAIRAADQVYVSAVSGWEVAVKVSLGRLKPKRTVAQATAESGFEELPLLLHHTARARDLPWHHRDPFDRMIAAQALTEGLVVVTRDAAFRRYGVKVVKG